MGRISIETLEHEGSFTAYAAEPEGTPRAAILVIQEIFGVNEGIRRKCDRWAELGYFAIAPDLFWRLEPGVELDPDVEAEFKQALGLMNRFDQDQGIMDIEASIRAARARLPEGCGVGAVGYCLGGRLAFMTAARTDIDASTGYYAVGVDGLLHEKHAIAHPLMLHVAGADHFVGPEIQRAMHQGLDDHPKVTLHDYPGEDHGFAAEMGKRRSEEAATLADSRTEDILRPASRMSDPYGFVLRGHGGPEILEAELIDFPRPEAGQVRIRHEAVGLNFIDTYHRSGLYKLPLPAGLGIEAAGIIETLGEGVTDFCEGDRVGYFTGTPGAYASHRTILADKLVELPDSTSFEQAAASLLKGTTAEYLIERCARVEPGQAVLVHAAAGGVGSILVPWLKHVGATVIAHAGDSKKAGIASGLGADHALCCPMDALAGEVRALTEGRGVPIVLDGVGAASWKASLGSVARRGLIVSYGNASGPVPPFSALDLLTAGSIFVTRPTLADYCATPDEMRASAARLFELIGKGVVDVRIGARFDLKKAADAHRAIEARATTGSTVLLP